MAIYKGTELLSNKGSSPQHIINSPHLWPVNQEIAFGDGSFGVRVIGFIEVPARVYINVNIYQIGVPANIINAGGWLRRATATKHLIGGTSYAQADASLFGDSSIYIDGNGAIGLGSWSVNARVGSLNNDYDIWIRYTKV